MSHSAMKSLSMKSSDMRMQFKAGVAATCMRSRRSRILKSFRSLPFQSNIRQHRDARLEEQQRTSDVAISHVLEGEAHIVNK
eukprot:4454189-Amphidinium_carterae.1